MRPFVRARSRPLRGWTRRVGLASAFCATLALPLGTLAAQLPGAARVGRLDVQGNHHFSRKAIARLLRLAPTHSFPFGTRHPVFYADFLRTDLRSVESLYHNAGYLDVQVSATHRRVVRGGNEEVDITVSIQEGPLTRFGSVVLTGVTVAPVQQVQKLLAARPGHPYNELLFPIDRETVKNWYFERGYILVSVNPAVEGGLGDTLVDLTYEVTERWPVNFGTVAVRDTAGELRTEEKVIRRNIVFHEGETFSSSKLSESEQRLYDTGLFSDVHFDMSSFDRPDTSRVVDLNLYLVERKFRYVGGGVEYDAQSNLTLSTEGGLRNVSGMNRRLEATASAGVGMNRVFNNGRIFSVSHLGLTFTEPWFLGTREQATVGLFHDFVRDQQLQTQRTTSTALSFALRRDLSRQTHVIGEVRNAWVRQLGVPVTDTAAAEPPTRFQNRTLNLSLDSDLRDNFFNPSRGSLWGIQGQYAGLGGQTHFLKGLASGSVYQPVTKTVVFAARLRAGVIRALRGATPDGVTEEQADLAKIDIANRFRLGGAATVRAYGEDAIGKENIYDTYVDPADTTMTVQFHPGGVALLLMNAELRWMLNRRLGLAGFVDAGNVWSALHDVTAGRFLPAGSPLGPNDMRWDVGAGIRLMTPLGPARVDYAWKIGAPPVSYGPVAPNVVVEQEKPWRITIALGQAF